MSKKHTPVWASLLGISLVLGMLGAAHVAFWLALVAAVLAYLSLFGGTQ